MFTVLYDKRVFKDMDRIPNKDTKKIADRLAQLAKVPLPVGSEKLMGGAGMYRIRQGNYRILYTVNHPQKQVHVHHVGNRKEVYR